MSEPPADALDTPLTLALSTKLEEDFVAPLTAVRGALEILRDFPDLPPVDHQRFVTTALTECARLERGIEDLAATVYAAGQRTYLGNPSEPSPEDQGAYASRFRILEEHGAIEVDLSDFLFDSSAVVNEYYDALEKVIQSTGRAWYFIVNYRDTSIWPEAWFAFAHRAKKINVTYSLGTVRYVEGNTDTNAPDMFESRELALQHIDDMRRSASRA